MATAIFVDEAEETVDRNRPRHHSPRFCKQVAAVRQDRSLEEIDGEAGGEGLGVSILNGGEEVRPERLHRAVS